MLLFKKHLNIIDILLKLILIFAILSLFWFIPIFEITYEYNGSDRFIDIDYYRIEYKYNFFGYKIETETTHEDFNIIDVINNDFIQGEWFLIIFILVYGIIPLLLIVNIWKYPEIKYKELIILAMLTFSIFIISFIIYDYFSAIKNKIDVIRSHYFLNEISPDYGDEIDVIFASEFPFFIISQTLIIVIGSIIYEKLIKKHKIVILSNSFLIKFLKKAINMEEAQLWDFKTTLGMWHAETNDQKNITQVKFCEDFAAFANSKGGLLIIGISDKIPREFYDINDLERNKQRIAIAIRRWTDFKREFYFLNEISLKCQKVERTCLILLIAQTKNPIGVRQPRDFSYKYPYRTETGKEWMSYPDIANIKKGISSNNTNFIIELKKILR